MCRAVRRRCTGRRFLTASVIATRERRATVPMRCFLYAQPGYIYLLRRPSWENCTYRSDQKRARLEDGFAGGWNPVSSTHPTLREVAGDPEGRKLLIEYLTLRSQAIPIRAVHDSPRSK